jgi:hypothetical protein
LDALGAAAGAVAAAAGAAVVAAGLASSAAKSPVALTRRSRVGSFIIGRFNKINFGRFVHNFQLFD